MWITAEQIIRRFAKYLPWQVKYLLGKAGVGGLDISIDRHFEYAFVVKRLKAKIPGVLVDVGGAGSLLSPIMSAMGFKVIGYDLHSWGLKYPNYEHRVGNACRMDLPNNAIDVCVSISCVEHMDTSRYKSDDHGEDRVFAEEILRVLRPGGSFILSVPYGTAGVFPAHRVYDEEGLSRLMKGFKEISREIFIPRDDSEFCHYQIGHKEGALIERPWHRYSVIALELQKPA